MNLIPQQVVNRFYTPEELQKKHSIVKYGRLDKNNFYVLLRDEKKRRNGEQYHYSVKFVTSTEKNTKRDLNNICHSSFLWKIEAIREEILSQNLN